MNLDKLSKVEMSNPTLSENPSFNPDNRIELTDIDRKGFMHDADDLSEQLGNVDPDRRLQLDGIDHDKNLDSISDMDHHKTVETGEKVFNPDDRINNSSSEIANNTADASDKMYYDDNGKQYRDGDNLIPNNRYELNGYVYETDDKGRIVSVEGKLKVVDSHPRNMEKDINTVGKGYEKENDNKGHLIGHQFGGDDRLGNLVSQDKKENQGAYAKLENKLAEAVKEGKNVTVDIKVDYLQGSHRPSKIVYTYSIDGNVSQQTFKNRSNT